MPFLRQYFLGQFNRNQGLFSFQKNFFFLLQKMDNKVINKKSEIAEIVKIFKQNLELKSGEMSERQLKILKRCIEKNEKIINNKEETDIEYINDKLDNIKRVFNGFCCMYNINYTPKTSTIDDSIFIGTPDLIKNKKCTINPQNKDNKCFQYQRLNDLLTILIGKILIFHQKNKIIINLK